MTFPPLPNGRVWGSVLSRTVLVGRAGGCTAGRRLWSQAGSLELGQRGGLGDAQPHQVLGLTLLSYSSGENTVCLVLFSPLDLWKRELKHKAESNKCSAAFHFPAFSTVTFSSAVRGFSTRSKVNHVSNASHPKLCR